VAAKEEEEGEVVGELAAADWTLAVLGVARREETRVRELELGEGTGTESEDWIVVVLVVATASRETTGTTRQVHTVPVRQ